MGPTRARNQRRRRRRPGRCHGWGMDAVIGEVWGDHDSNRSGRHGRLCRRRTPGPRPRPALSAPAKAVRYCTARRLRPHSQEVSRQPREAKAARRRGDHAAPGGRRGERQRHARERLRDAIPIGGGPPGARRHDERGLSADRAQPQGNRLGRRPASTGRMIARPASVRAPTSMSMRAGCTTGTKRLRPSLISM